MKKKIFYYFCLECTIKGKCFDRTIFYVFSHLLPCKILPWWRLLILKKMCHDLLFFVKSLSYTYNVMSGVFLHCIFWWQINARGCQITTTSKWGILTYQPISGSTLLKKSPRRSAIWRGRLPRFWWNPRFKKGNGTA